MNTMYKTLQNIYKQLREQRTAIYCTDNDDNAEYVANHFRKEKYKVEVKNNCCVTISKRWWMK